MFAPEVLGACLFPQGLLSAPQCLPVVGLTLPLLWRLWPVSGGGAGMASAGRVGSVVATLCEPLAPGCHQTSEGVGRQRRRASAISGGTSRSLDWRMPPPTAECAWDGTPKGSFLHYPTPPSSLPRGQSVGNDAGTPSGPGRSCLCQTCNEGQGGGVAGVSHSLKRVWTIRCGRTSAAEQEAGGGGRGQSGLAQGPQGGRDPRADLALDVIWFSAELSLCLSRLSALC